MNPNHLKELLKKIADGSASEKEKLEALREANALIEEYNKALKEGLAKNPA
jgi:hypothetical protein